MKKASRIIVKFILLMSLLLLISSTLKYVLVDDAEDNFRGKMLNFYAQDNIDTLFLGSSHVFCGINTDILEEKWNEDVYLAATSVQKPDASYYLLKEAVKNHKIKRVFLDMYYHQYRDNPDERTAEQLKYIYCVSDYMNWSWDKVEFIWNACPIESMLRAFIPAIRYGDNLLDFDYIDRVVKSKNHDDYRNPVIDITDKGYRGGDINGEYTKIGEGNFVTIIDTKEEPEIVIPPISDYSLKYLKKIIELCKENNIELVLFTTPMTDFIVNVLDNYDDFHNYVEKLAKDNKIEFLDFNLYNPNFGEFSDEMHSDDHHLNAFGAYYFSELLSECISDYENGTKINNRFCETFEEKQKKENSRFYGILLEKTGHSYHIVPIQNTNEELKKKNRYFVSVAKEEAADNSYIIPINDDVFEIDETGIFIIKVKTVDYDGNVHEASTYVNETE